MRHTKCSLEIDLASQDQDIYTAALWAKQQFQEHPNSTLGCMIPNLNQNYLQILDAFTEILAPESLLPGHNDPLPFHIIMARPLHDYPIISIALLALSLDNAVNPTLSISRLLHSPFIGSSERLIEYAQLDAELRSHFETHIFTDKLPGFISEAIKSPHPHEQKLPAWAQAFTEQLQHLGWPGPRHLNKEEFQTLERWQALLVELSNLEPPTPTLSREQALNQLMQLSKNTVYQPCVQGSPPIQIFESFEMAAQIAPECLWVMGSEKSRIDLESPLYISYAEQIYQTGQLESITDSKGPSVGAQEHIRGGSDILKQQAACPFKAFAKHRLHAHEIAPQQLGLHAMERGQILHSVLEQLWHHLEDHQRLCSLAEDSIDQSIFSSIDKVLNNFQRYKPYTFKKKFMHLERQRLFNLLKKWLAIEKERSPFKVVAKELRQKTNHLNFTLQIDRIDETEDGGHIIIDYKTGQVAASDCLGDRPNEPQLPLYYVTHPRPIASILFAQIRSKQMRFIELPPQPEEWKTTLLHLEKDFYDGNALVDPKYHKQTCKQCTLQTLCRISEKLK